MKTIKEKQEVLIETFGENVRLLNIVNRLDQVKVTNKEGKIATIQGSAAMASTDEIADFFKVRLKDNKEMIIEFFNQDFNRYELLRKEKSKDQINYVCQGCTFIASLITY